MSIERNKAVLLRAYEIWNSGQFNLADEILAPDIVFHHPVLAWPEPLRGIEAVKQIHVRMRASFPDVQFTVDDIVGEGDMVVVRYTTHQTHNGEFQGIPPTGKRVSNSAIEWARVADGKIQEIWLMLNPLHLINQLGGPPRMGPPPR